EGVFECRAGQSVRGPLAERSARRGDDHGADIDAGSASDALKDGAMLAVDRNDLAAARLGSGGHQLARHDERFLIGKCYSLAFGQSSKRRIEAGRPDDGVQHDVDVVEARRLDQTRRAHAPFRMRLGAILYNADEARLKSRRLLSQKRGVVERSES